MAGGEPESTDVVDVSGVVDWARKRDPVRWVLGGMVAVWIVTFVTLGWIRHVRFGTYGFDLGIFDQGIWLLSRFESFITVRGLPVFGNHANLILLAFVPLYRLGGGPLLLLVAQVAAQASGAISVYLLARDRFGDRWLGLLPAAALLLNPTYQYLTWEFFHPEPIAAAALLFACWAAQAKRWRWFTVAVVLAVACKEDVALAAAGLGVLVLARGDRKIGLATIVGSLGWYAVVTRLLIPLALGGHAPFYEGWFPALGDNVGEVLWSIVTKPGVVFDLATGPGRYSYFVRMFLPVALLALGGWRTMLLIAGPALAVNFLTVAEFARDYRYHYSALVVAGLIVGTVEMVARVGRRTATRRVLAGLLVAAAFVTTVLWGPSPLSSQFRTGIWPLEVGSLPDTKQQALREVPPNAVASATYTFVPHMTHRSKIYQFPEPWYPVAWGIGGKGLPDPTTIEWLVVDRRNLLFERERALFDALVSREFEVRFTHDDVVVARRAPRPEPPPNR